MFWSDVKKELRELGATCEEWSVDYMTMAEHNNICGIRGRFPNGQDYSIISHKYSYGGDKDEFEIMSSCFEDEVRGYLSESEAIDLLREIAE